MQNEIRIGSVVFSKAGRDAGKFFCVIEIVDDTFVKVADGGLRKLDKPKLKKIKHLKIEEAVLEKISEKLKSNKKVFDAEIYSALKIYNG